MAKIITVAQQKGGAGKSTIAAHIAVGLTFQGFKVALIDIDPQGSLTEWHSLREKFFGKGYAGVNFANCSGIRVNNEISRLNSLSDYLIIDCPPHTETEAKSAIRAADIVVIPAQPSPTDLWATTKTIEFSLSEKKLVKLLMNRYNPNARLVKQLDLPKKFMLKSFLGNRVGFASSMVTGRTVFETEPKSQASIEMKQVISEIVELLK